MKKIIHFHPNRMYSEYFVEPLIKFEENMGNKVTLVNSIKIQNYFLDKVSEVPSKLDMLVPL